MKKKVFLNYKNAVQNTDKEKAEIQNHWGGKMFMRLQLELYSAKGKKLQGSTGNFWVTCNRCGPHHKGVINM